MFVAGLALLGPLGAEAQEFGDIEDFLELPGVCESGPITFGPGVDCAVAIRDDVDLDDIWFVGFVDGNDQLGGQECSVAADGVPGLVEDRPAVWCRDLGKGEFFDGIVDGQLEGPWETASAFEYEIEDLRGNFWWFNGPHLLAGGRPLAITDVPDLDLDGLWLRFVERRTGEVALDLPAASAAQVVDPAIDELGGIVSYRWQPELDPGSYRLWFCEGDSPETCALLPGGHHVQVHDLEFLELVPGHNVIDAERINVVFFGSGMEALAHVEGYGSVEETARTMLGWDGPVSTYLTAFEGEDGSVDGRVRWGPFATEPMASDRHRFNLWYAPQPLDDIDTLFQSVGDPLLHAGFDLPNVHAVLLQGDGRLGRSDARLASLADREFPETANELVFGNTRMNLEAFDLTNATQVLTHEWGHALFGLRDEYAFNPFGTDGIGYGDPNCLRTLDEAETLYGDLFGIVDPFAETVLAQLAELGRDPDQEFGFDLIEATRIEPTPGGCYGDPEDPAVYRPNISSAMNETSPVFGAVSRRQMEAVLGLFSGRADHRGLDGVAIACTGDDDSTSCGIEIPAFVDGPDAGFTIDGEACGAGVGGGDGPTVVTCELDAAAAAVEIGDGGEVRTLTVEREIVETTTSTTTAGPTEGDDETAARTTATTLDDSDGSGSTRLIAGVALVGAGAAVFAVLAMLSRRPRSASR